MVQEEDSARMQGRSLCLGAGIVPARVQVEILVGPGQGLVKGEAPCGVKGQRPLVRPGGQPWPNKVLDATLNIGLLSVTHRAELTASPGKAS